MSCHFLVANNQKVYIFLLSFEMLKYGVGKKKMFFDERNSPNEILRSIETVTLDEIITNVEKATNLYFPTEIKYKIKFKTIIPDKVCEVTLDVMRSLYKREPSEEDKRSYGSDYWKSNMRMIVDPEKYVIYSCEENIKKVYDGYNLEPYKLVTKSHEVGHLLGWSLVPEFNKVYEESYCDSAKNQRVNLLDEGFGVYVQVKFTELTNLKGMFTCIDHFTECCINHVNKFDLNYFDNIISSDSPLAYVREELKRIGK